MMIKSLYALLAQYYLNNVEGEFFKTSVGVRQGCLLSPTLFNVFLEEIMSKTQSNYSSSISVGGRPLWNLKFADDIDCLLIPTRNYKNSQIKYQEVQQCMEW